MVVTNGQKYRRLSPEEILAQIEKMKQGRLKVYVGAAPGVGKHSLCSKKPMSFIEKEWISLSV